MLLFRAAIVFRSPLIERFDRLDASIDSSQHAADYCRAPRQATTVAERSTPSSLANSSAAIGFWK